MAPVLSQPSSIKDSSPVRASLPRSCKYKGTYYTQQSSVASSNSSMETTTVHSYHPRHQRTKPTTHELFGSSEETSTDGDPDYSTVGSVSSSYYDPTSPANSIVVEEPVAATAFTPPDTIFVDLPEDLRWLRYASPSELLERYLELRDGNCCLEALLGDAKARLIDIERHYLELGVCFRDLSRQCDSTINAVYQLVTHTNSKLDYLTGLVEDQIIDNYRPTSTPLPPIKQEPVE